MIANTICLIVSIKKKKKKLFLIRREYLISVRLENDPPYSKRQVNPNELHLHTIVEKEEADKLSTLGDPIRANKSKLKPWGVGEPPVWVLTIRTVERRSKWPSPLPPPTPRNRYTFLPTVSIPLPSSKPSPRQSFSLSPFARYKSRKLVQAPLYSPPSHRVHSYHGSLYTHS